MASKNNIEAARRELNFISRTAQASQDYELVDAVMRALSNVRLELDEIEADAQPDTLHEIPADVREPLAA